MFEPSEMAFDHTGNFYIADTLDGRIRVVNTSGIINTFAGGGSSGLGDGGPPTSATLSEPEGVAVDSSGNVYIADTGNNRIRKVAGNVISTIAGTGFSGYNGDNQAATNAQIYGPNGIVVDSLGNVYFSDSNNNRIRRISTGGIISTIAGTGTAGFSGDGGFATAALLSDPTSLAIDSVGNLYFIDYQNGRVREISTAGLITTVAGNGMGYPITGDGGPATSASLYFAGGLAVDASGSSTSANGTPVFERLPPTASFRPFRRTPMVITSGDLPWTPLGTYTLASTSRFMNSRRCNLSAVSLLLLPRHNRLPVGC